MGTATWRDPAWQRGVGGWVADRLAELGRRATAPAQFLHLRPWAAVARVPTADGPVWFKAAAPATAYEAALLDRLRAVDSRHLLVPLALDLGRGWSLLPDGGRTLREELAKAPQRRLPRWEQVLPAHAELQRVAGPTVPALLAAGVPDMRPGELPAVVERLLAAHAMPDELCRAAERWLPGLRHACAELADSAVPATIQHDDLHDANVLVSAAAPRFMDWGDASVAHPFGVFLVLRRSLCRAARIALHDSTLTRLEDAYLEAFTDRQPLPQLRRELALAEYVGGVARVESWRRAMLSATADEQAEYEHPVTSWLAELVEDPPP